MICVLVSSPGTYNPEIKPPPRITWPMKFGSPDWAQVPCLQKRTLKAEVTTSGCCRAHALVLPCVSRVLNQGLEMSCRKSLFPEIVCTVFGLCTCGGLFGKLHNFIRFFKGVLD